MTSPPRQISLICPTCRFTYKKWHRASLNLSLDPFDDEYVRAMSVGTCPRCKTVVELETLIVDEDGVWRAP